MWRVMDTGVALSPQAGFRFRIGLPNKLATRTTSMRAWLVPPAMISIIMLVTIVLNSSYH